MPEFLLSPVSFYGQILLALALAAALGAYVASPGNSRPTRRLRQWLQPYLDVQHSTAVGLGLSLRAFMTLRLAAALAGLFAGLLIGTPVVVVGCALAGLLAVPFLLGPIADQRRVRVDQALIDQLRSLIDLVKTSNQTLDEALKDAGENPIPVLRRILAPLADTSASIRDRLIEVDRRAVSPIANRLCADLLLSLDVAPEAFVQEAAEVLIPQYEADLVLQERNFAVATGARTAAYIVAAIMGVVFLAVMRVENFREAYATPAGQLVLIAVATLVAGVFWSISRLTPHQTTVKWDLEEVKAQMEKRYA